jgi:hypothetical protein
MISGPVLTRTREDLRGITRRHLERIERGLRIVQDDLLLDDGCRVDALACDARGTPVLLFLSIADEDRDLPGRVLDAAAWMEANPRLLAQALPLRGIDYGKSPRVLVVGFDLADALLARLGALRLASLDVFRVQWFSAGGQVRVGVVPLLGGAARGDDDGYRVPTGLEEPRARSLCMRLLDLLQRIDPELEARGDRFSRRFSIGGEPVAELWSESDGLRLAVIDERRDHREVLTLADWDECEAATDRVMRRYLDCCNTEAEPAPAATGAAPSFAGIRRSAAQAQLSREEYAVLGESLAAGDDD